MDRNKVDLRIKEQIVGKIVRAEGHQISIGFNRVCAFIISGHGRLKKKSQKSSCVICLILKSYFYVYILFSIYFIFS